MLIQSLGREDPLKEEMALQYPCFENPMDRGAWQATVHEAAKSQTRLHTHEIAKLIKNINDIIFNHSTANSLLTVLLTVSSY